MQCIQTNTETPSLALLNHSCYSHLDDLCCCPALWAVCTRWQTIPDVSDFPPNSTVLRAGQHCITQASSAVASRRGAACLQQLCQQQRQQLHWGSSGYSINVPTSRSSTGCLPGDTNLPDPAADAAADLLAAAAGVASAAPDLGFFAAGAAALEALHAATGLPWVAVIPAAAVAIKTLLLPISLKQAKIVRTNMVLWKEAYEFQKQQDARLQRQQQEQQQPQQQEGTQQQQQQPQLQLQLQPQQQATPASAAAGAGQGPLDAAATALQQLQHWQQRLALFHDLRRKCGVPHPAWLFVNSSLQVCADGRCQSRMQHVPISS